MKCLACSNSIEKGELLGCVTCKRNLSLQMFEYYNGEIYGQFPTNQRTWKCPTCTNVTKRRHRNNDTLIKINREESSPSDLFDMSCDNISQTEDSNEQLSPNMKHPGVPKVNTFSFPLEEVGKLLDQKLDSKLIAHVCLATEIKQEFRDVLKNLESDFKQITESLTQKVCNSKNSRE
ncbi:unnamed protein product [Parnassius apollo]|uniref:(apollo) hypothetical protein n=1 Tax=Parnassius apollo TaxID=110799 RepID=A0A8S3WJ53_PARAO|nr:unnamed protein product [Parnassius apollo]